MFRYTHRVTYADCTVGNHVYYARYLDWLEAARGDFFRNLGAALLDWQAQGVIFPVVEARQRYHAAARYDDTVAIELWPTAAAGARLNFAYRLRNQSGALLLEAETFHACTDLEGKPRRLPPELVARLQPSGDPQAG